MGVIEQKYRLTSALNKIVKRKSRRSVLAVAKASDEEAAFYYQSTVIPKMDALRAAVDEMETLTDREYWPMPTYGDIIFKV